MSDPDDSAERKPDDDEGVLDDAPDQGLISFQTQPSTTHPLTGEDTTNYVKYVDFTGNAARFDLDRLKLWPPPGADCWYGHGPHEGEMLCRVRLAQGRPIRWVLLDLDRDDGGNREVFPRDAAEWLEGGDYLLPDDLDPAPPFDPSTPPRGRLARDWRPPDRTPKAPPSGVTAAKTNILPPGPRVIAAALELREEGRPVSLKAACDRAGADRTHVRERYPDTVTFVRALAAPERSPRRGMCDRRTGNIDAVDESEE